MFGTRSKERTTWSMTAFWSPFVSCVNSATTASQSSKHKTAFQIESFVWQCMCKTPAGNGYIQTCTKFLVHAPWFKMIVNPRFKRINFIATWIFVTWAVNHIVFDFFAASEIQSSTAFTIMHSDNLTIFHHRIQELIVGWAWLQTWQTPFLKKNQNSKIFRNSR